MRFNIIAISFFLLASSLAAETPKALQLHTRARTETAKGSAQYEVAQKVLEWDPHKTAIVICDMWDKHWCKGATARVAEMAPRMNEVIKKARQQGVFIIHAPSSTMEFYKDTSQRKLALAAPKAQPKVPLKTWCSLDSSREAALPIDDSDGGCDDHPPCAQGSPWRRQIATIEIAEGDAITDSEEAYNLLQQRGLENVIVMGVHVNMCILGRPFSIRQMIYQGKNVLLMRDLTDSMYNSRMPPYVSHFRGNELVVEHIEKFWCASITSADFLGGEPFHFKDDQRPQIAFIVGENEYHTQETLPEFAKKELESRGFKCSFVNANPEGGNEFANFQAVKNADLLVISVRRRTPLKEQLDLIRQHLEAGKPLVGIRTASHAWDAKVPDDRHDAWPTFDVDVLGAKYEGHYNNTPPKDPGTFVKIIPEAAVHPVLRGVSSNEFGVTSHLYKNRNLAATVTRLMMGRVDGSTNVEPVAWVNTAHNRRVFYTSLGNPDDFKLPAFRRLLLNGILWSLDQPIPPPPLPQTKTEARKQSGPLSPSVSLTQFNIAEDLEIEQLLAEPIVRQPVFLNFDERGRMWVVQYLQYPDPAGLKLLSKDNFWRAVYDKIPPPPPHHFIGQDKITIHEDTDGDGVFDKHKTFLEGLNIVTAVTKGRGGVWVMNPPYLLFYPDRNNDDLPDGDPEVHLAGFGLEDTHSVANSLRWGPDGWLYAAQGSTVTGNIVRPGIDKEPSHSMGQLIWRYHPETRRYEVYAEGGGNAFGCEIDPKGRIFSGHNGGNTRGFHYVQGAYLQKGFEKHGPLSNPYAFGFFPPMPHPDVERFTHNFVIYGGGALPPQYEGKLFGVEPLQGRVVESEIQPDRSSFKTHDLSHPVTTGDSWFRPVDIKVGPDGALYIADWYDEQVNHFRNHEGKIDTSNGRIYRLKGKGAKPIPPFDLGKLATTQLVELLNHKNEWQRQTALRLIGDRKDRSVIPMLTESLSSHTGQFALEAFWALNLSGGFNDDVARRTLEHKDPFVRLWTIRLLGDANQVSAPISRQLEQMARIEPDLEVRSQLASTSRRLPAKDALAIVRNLLAHAEDANDNRIPLLLWWAIESKAESDRETVMKLFEDPSLWDFPLVQKHLLERIMRRYAQAGTRKDLLTCARLVQLSPGAEQTSKLMAGFEAAFKGRSLGNLPDELIDAMARHGGDSLVLNLRQGQAEAVGKALQVITDEKADAGKRRQYIQILGEVKQPAGVPALLSVVRRSADNALRKAALMALQQTEDPKIGTEIIAVYNSLTNDVRTAALALLASRSSWSLQLLQAVDACQIKPDAIPRDVVRQIELHKDPEVAKLVKKNWGQTRNPSTAEMEKRIHHLAQTIQTGLGDPFNGQKMFSATCAACHKLFGQGGQVGPDLTTYKRDDLGTMLLSIINPNAEIREGYENYVVSTKDDRTLTGFLVERDNRVVVLRGLDGQNTVLDQKEIQEMNPAGMSLMPEGLLDAFDEKQVRDLFAYLRSTQPLVK